MKEDFGQFREDKGMAVPLVEKDIQRLLTGELDGRKETEAPDAEVTAAKLAVYLKLMETYGVVGDTESLGAVKSYYELEKQRQELAAIATKFFDKNSE